MKVTGVSAPPKHLSMTARINGWRTNMNELQIFAEPASSEAFVYLSLIFILDYAAGAAWLLGKASVQETPRASLVHRAL
jgi:hypothetical protein